MLDFCHLCVEEVYAFFLNLQNSHKTAGTLWVFQSGLTG